MEASLTRAQRITLTELRHQDADMYVDGNGWWLQGVVYPTLEALLNAAG
jgi:hypothetical protein